MTSEEVKGKLNYLTSSLGALSMEYTTSSPSSFTQLQALYILLRPKQWIKNSFVFMPLIFSEQFLQPHLIQLSILAFIVFCLMASATYIINDIHDVEQDKLHPMKAKRPLATGAVSIKSALSLLFSLYTLLAMVCFFMPELSFPISAYTLLNLAYTFYLKNEPVVDIFIISIGFVLRIYTGAIAIHVNVSAWMFITTLCLSLYLAAIKRRQELILHQNTPRRSLEKYTLPLINKYAQMSAICAVMFYSMFVMSAKPQLIMTIPITLFGLFRYWYVVECLALGESPTDALFEDWPLALTVLIWIGTCIWILWPIGV
jgi:decaprenyl-phosphate phosphoribosyltransferase